MSKNKLIIIIVIAFIAGLSMRSNIFNRLKAKLSDSSSITAKEKPYIEFIRLETPKTVKQGESFLMNAYFKPLRRIDAKYKLFVHLYTGTGKGWINADRFPIPSTLEWQPNQEIKIGPMQVFINDNAPLGTYNIEMGLFYSKKIDDKERYIRLPYANRGDHLLGKIRVVKGEKITEEAALAKFAKEAKLKQDNTEYVIAIENSLKKVFRQIEKCDSLVANEVNVSSARNEYESFQIVAIPLTKNLENIHVSVTDLQNVNTQETINVKNISVRPVGYTQTEKPDYPTEFIGAWPDALLESKEASAIKGEVQPFWVTVYAPPEATSGNYQGYISIKPENSKELRIKINLRVYNFCLPERFHLRTAFDLYDIYIEKRYDVQNDDLVNMELKYYADMLAHHISPIYIYGNPKELRDSMGAKALDFDGFDRNLTLSLKWGLNAFSIVRKWGGENDNKWGSEKEIRETLSCYADYLKMRNLFDMAYIYVFDEPKPHNAEKIRNITKLIHETNPNFKTLVTIHPDEQWGDDIDIWCPHLINFRQDIAEQERAKGKQTWWYVSGVRPGTPAFNIDLPAIDHRIVFWMNWKYNVEGLLYWCINYWKKNPWETAMTWPDENGNGCLLYPGKNGPVDTIRIEVIRDGLEDYEYLYQLKDLTAQLQDKQPDSELIKEAQGLLNIGRDIITTTSEYTKDTKVLLKTREEIAQLIEKIGNILTKYTE